ncbi:hypothetical protein HHK36_020275 [Tetracentron sinense]|uniref:Uncharacterized protein n=1 Tax=Tetracentron sinense TaxID=13715 RepID=A0A834YYQ2_TETSI|nr:hypothetical protein HHK36_020275 [Tetracentron sinense]
MLEVVKSILLLRYNDLPYYLKHCFLYCCILPEDYIIKRKRLIRLWVAEGFVKDRRGMTPEEVADTYLRELISRSMLQVVAKNRSGRAKWCRMHDLMRELALSTSEKEKFCTIGDGGKAREGGKALRLSIQTNIQLGTSLSQLRSLLVFVEHMTPLPSGFRMLRVLDLENIKLKYKEKLPDELGDLFNLRSLPSGIVKLQRLRNLNTNDMNAGYFLILKMGGFEQVMWAPADLWKLKNLQVVGTISANGGIIKQLGNMTQLRRIGIAKVRERDQTELCASISRLRHLYYLVIGVTNEERFLRMDALSSPPPLLEKLFLYGKLEKVPHWFGSLQKLTYLSLNWSKLTEDPLSYIHALPNLVELILVNAYDGRKLWFLAGFLKL